MLQILNVWDFTPREIANARIGFYEIESERNKASWEQTRWLSFWVVKSMSGEKEVKQPSDLAQFPWEFESNKLKQAEKIEKVQSDLKRAAEIFPDKL